MISKKSCIVLHDFKQGFEIRIYEYPKNYWTHHFLLRGNVPSRDMAYTYAQKRDRTCQQRYRWTFRDVFGDLFQSPSARSFHMVWDGFQTVSTSGLPFTRKSNNTISLTFKHIANTPYRSYYKGFAKWFCQWWKWHDFYRVLVHRRFLANQKPSETKWGRNWPDEYGWITYFRHL